MEFHDKFYQPEVLTETHLALGASYAVLGLFSLFSLLIADATQPRVAWEAPGVWVWMGLFAVLFVVGLALIWWSSSQMQGGS